MGVIVAAVQKLHKEFYFGKVFKPCDDNSRWANISESYNQFYHVMDPLN